MTLFHFLHIKTLVHSRFQTKHIYHYIFNQNWSFVTQMKYFSWLNAFFDRCLVWFFFSYYLFLGSVWLDTVNSCHVTAFQIYLDHSRSSYLFVPPVGLNGVKERRKKRERERERERGRGEIAIEIIKLIRGTTPDKLIFLYMLLYERDPPMNYVLLQSDILVFTELQRSLDN